MTVNYIVHTRKVEGGGSSTVTNVPGFAWKREYSQYKANKAILWQASKSKFFKLGKYEVTWGLQVIPMLLWIISWLESQKHSFTQSKMVFHNAPRNYAISSFPIPTPTDSFSWPHVPLLAWMAYHDYKIIRTIKGGKNSHGHKAVSQKAVN